MTGSGSRHPHCDPRQGYGNREITRRRETVKAWRGDHGDHCPGYDRPPHPSSDLTADHVVPVAAGGSEDGPLGVLCRQCNARKRDQLT